MKDQEYDIMLSTLKVDTQTVKDNYTQGKNGEVVYGAFKPNFSNKEEFEQYWKESTMDLGFSSYHDQNLMVDYIWYQGDGIKLLKVLDVPSLYDDMTIFEVCPNEVVPSDHLPLMAQFYID